VKNIFTDYVQSTAQQESLATVEIQKKKSIAREEGSGR